MKSCIDRGCNDRSHAATMHIWYVDQVLVILSFNRKKNWAMTAWHSAAGHSKFQLCHELITLFLLAYSKLRVVHKIFRWKLVLDFRFYGFSLFLFCMEVFRWCPSSDKLWYFHTKLASFNWLVLCGAIFLSGDVFHCPGIIPYDNGTERTDGTFFPTDGVFSVRFRCHSVLGRGKCVELYLKPLSDIAQRIPPPPP